ncbi:hypothetical protein AMTRI_Chr04g248070 [Amborella trichopoda]
MIRLALLRAKKGGIFKRGFMGNLKFLTRGPHHSEITAYRQFSFGDSPAFPCINPPVTFDNGYNDDYDNDIDSDGVDNRYGAGYDYDHGDDHSHQGSYYNGDGDGDDDCDCDCDPGESKCDALIDSRADEFIERFYQQMRLQRQVSFFKI